MTDDLRMPGESTNHKRGVHSRVKALQAKVPEPVWTFGKIAQAIVVVSMALGFVACLISGAGVQPCAGAACAQAKSILSSTTGTAIAATASSSSSFTLNETSRP